MITIFTPTFNREHTLARLYGSLKNQTNHSFEWIIVDDASQDKTCDLIESFKAQENLFDIVYIRQEHGGKHRAINKAVGYAKYDWFFIVDSDDFLTKDAVALVDAWIKKYGDEEKLAALSGSKYDINKNMAMSVPTILSNNPGIKCLNHERHKFDLDLDKAEVYKTAILKKYKFPEYDNEFFVTEAECWNRISYDGYYTRFFPEAIYCCEYLTDGLTNSGANTRKGFSKNYFGFLDYLNILLKVKECDWETINLTIFACKEGTKHKVSYKQLAEKLDLEEKVLGLIYSKRFKVYFSKIILKFCKRLKIFFEPKIIG